MSNDNYMPHANGALAVATFEPHDDNPLEVNALVHHVVGWIVSKAGAPVPIVPGLPPRWFNSVKWYPMFMPQGSILNYPVDGEAMSIDDVIQKETEKLIVQDKEDKPRPQYDH